MYNKNKMYNNKGASHDNKLNLGGSGNSPIVAGINDKTKCINNNKQNV